MKRFKNILIYTLIFTLLLPIFMDTYIVHANDKERKVDIELIDGKQFAKIAVTGNTGSSGLRYRTKGWWIQASFGGKDFPSSGQKFYTDSDLEGKNGSMVVYIPLSVKGKGKTPIYEFLGVPEEYYRQGGIVRFEAGQIIVHNGQETSPTYDSFNGINNGIRNRFGVSWPSSAQNDLKTYYNHRLNVKPEIDIDWIEATHITTDGKILEVEKKYPPEAGPYPIDAKEFEGYECIDPIDGKHVVNIEKRVVPKKHEVKFIYNTGDLQAVITGPRRVDEGEEFDLSSEDSYGTFWDFPPAPGNEIWWYRDERGMGKFHNQIDITDKITSNDITDTKKYVEYRLVIKDPKGKESEARHKVYVDIEPPEPPPKGEVVADLSLRATAGGGDLPYVVPHKESNLYYADEFRDAPLYAPQDGTAYFSRKDWDNFMSLNNSAQRTNFKSTYMEDPREESNYEPSFLNNIEYNYSRSTSTYELDEYKTKFYTYNSNSFDEDDPRENEARSAYNDHYQMKGYVDYFIRKYYFNLNDNYSGEYTFKGKVSLTDITGVSDEAEAIGKAPIRILRGIPFAVAEVTPNVCFVGEGVYVANKSFDRHNYIEKNYISIYNMDDGVEVYNFSDIEGTRLHNTDYIEKVNSASVEGVSVTFNKPGRYRATVSVWNDDTAADHDNVEFIVNTEPRPPVADFEIPPYVFAGEDIPIRCTSTDPDDDIVMRIWDYPDNEKPEYAGFLDPTSPGLSNEGGILRFLVTGTFTVKLTVVDSTGLEDSVEKEVQVMPPIPVAVITQDDESLDKENRKIVLHSRKSVSPSADPIQKDKTEWQIKPLEGQKTSSIKVDTENSNQEERHLLFKETGKYEITLSLHNKYTLNPLNWKDENISIRQTKMIIDVQEDLPPNANVILGNLKSPSFREDGEEVNVDIEAIMSSPDKDIIDYSYWKLWRDDNNDEQFTENELINKFEDQTKTQLKVKFKEGIKGKYQVELFAKEDFGQPTIPKFIVPDDYRTKSVIEHFYVNWIPDIEFSLEKWAYPDDTLYINDVIIKDEKENTTKVKWSLKEANKDVDIDEYTQNSLGKYGGAIRFKKGGFYTLTATVTDEIGQQFSWSQDIRIYPFPTAIINDSPEYRFYGAFEAKQNRRFALNGNSSYIYDEFGDGKHEIDRSKDYWEIIALDGQDVNKAVKVRNGTSDGLQNSIESTNRFVVKNKKLDIDLLFREPGKYKIRYQVTNVHGKKSAFDEKTITVKEDIKPLATFDVFSPTYRVSKTGGPAKLTSYPILATSPDADIIEIKEIRYRFDSNNDGSFLDEKWSNPIIVSGDRSDIDVPHVGMYQVKLLVREKFGQPTLEEFITSKDKLEYRVYNEIEVDNIRPTVDFSIVPSNKVDVVFTVGKTDKINTSLLDEKIERYVKTKLDGSSLDMIETKISTYSTDTISTGGAGAEDIFTKWENYPNNSGNWDFEIPRRIPSNIFDGRKYLGMSGFDTIKNTFTFEFDIKVEDTVRKGVFTHSGGPVFGTGEGLIQIYMTRNNINVTTRNIGEPGETLINYNGDFSKMQKITIVIKNNQAYLYIDGEHRYTGNKVNHNVVIYPSYLGGHYINNVFTGEIENVYVWERDLSSVEISNYKNGLDKSGVYPGLVWRAELGGQNLYHGGREYCYLGNNYITQYIIGNETFNTIGTSGMSSYFTGYWDKNAQNTEDIKVSSLVGVFNESQGHGNIAMTVRHTQQNGKINFYAFVWNGGNDAASGLYKVENENYSSGWIPQAIYGSSKKLLQKADNLPNWEIEHYYKVEVEARDNNIKVFVDGDMVINYTDDNNPLLRGSYSVASHNQRNIRFKDLEIQTGTTKRIDEALREPTWTENSHKFVVNINDGTNFTGVKVPTAEFYYTGEPQEWIAPYDGIYTIEAYGAGSLASYVGNGNYIRSSNRGGYSKGDIELEKGEKLYIYSGGQGKRAKPGETSSGGGWNGGGNASWGTYIANITSSGGGGATDVRYGGNGLNNRILVAGGASGTGTNSGGDGGGLETRNMNQSSSGNMKFNTLGATQTRGGYPLNNEITKGPQEGTLGKGGNGEEYIYGYGSSGGGGGYYGGSGGYSASWYVFGDYDLGRDGRYNAAGATGGTSYISGFSGCMPQNHPSGKIFTNMEMKAGVHEGNGFVRISHDYRRQDGSLLSMLLDDEMHYVGIGTKENQKESEGFIERNDGKGIFLLGNNPNLDKALDQLADYIIETVQRARKDEVSYILLNDSVGYEVMYDDYENDPQTEDSYWRYNHDEKFFENDLGRISSNNVWRSDSINTFDKVGKYEVEYRTRDNPVGKDDRFDNYRKWSEMLLKQPSIIYVHRKPIADFSITTEKIGSNVRARFVDKSYDLDHEQKSNKGLMTWEWSWKTATQDKWTTNSFSNKASGIAWINSQFNSKPISNDYMVRLRVRDIDGVNGQGEWSDPKVILITDMGLPPVAQFTLSDTILPINRDMKIKDHSYDPNGDPIVEWRWVLSKISGANQGDWRFNFNNTTNQYTDTKISETVNNTIKSLGTTNALGEYKLTLQVRDDTGPWGHEISTSEIYTQTFTVIPVNLPPKADFKIESNQNPPWTFPLTIGNMTLLRRLDDKTFFLEELIKWNEWAEDPDGHAMEYQWTLERHEVANLKDLGKDDDPYIISYSGGLAAGSPNKRHTNFKPFNNSLKSQDLKYGAYRITLNVNDLPPIPPFRNTDKETISITKDYYFIPEIRFIEDPSFTHDGEEVIIGDTINVKTVTSKEVTSVKMTLENETIELNRVSTSGNSSTWEQEYVIPEDLVDKEGYELIFEASTNYGGNGLDTRKIKHSVPIDITVLKLINFRITDIVNHKPWWQKEYPSLNLHRDIKANPIYIDEMAVPYKAGYYVTFMIDSKGKPDTVTSKVTIDMTPKPAPVTINLSRYNGDPDIWIGRYHSSARIPVGSIINMELEATKGTRKYNYNEKEPWNGQTLKVEGSALQDGRVNRTN